MQAGVKVVVDCPEELPVMADCTKLRQILANIVSQPSSCSHRPAISPLQHSGHPLCRPQLLAPTILLLPSHAHLAHTLLLTVAPFASHPQVSNSLKFTEHGHVRLTATRASGSMVVLAVEDTGPGIPQKHQKRLFTK